TGNQTHKSPVTCRLSNRTKPNRSTCSGGLGQYLPTACRHTYRQPALASLPLTPTRGLPGKHRAVVPTTSDQLQHSFDIGRHRLIRINRLLVLSRIRARQPARQLLLRTARQNPPIPQPVSRTTLNLFYFLGRNPARTPEVHVHD